jgi:hypothetical protein
MAKWEYVWREGVDKDDREDVANRLGEQEWEFVQEVQEAAGNFCTLVFKRERRNYSTPLRAGPLGTAALDIDLSYTK